MILKGQFSLVVSPSGEIWTNLTGNSGLATAGSGDVLSGILVSLLAQGWQMADACKAAVWLHGTAADYLVAQGIVPIGLTASELINTVRDIRNRIAY